MTFLLYAHTLTGLVLLACHADAVLTLFLPGGKGLPYPQRGYEESRRRSWALGQLRKAFGWYCALTGFAHVYERQHLELEMAREAALMQPLPYGCGGNFDWDKLTLGEKLEQRLLVGGLASEKRCADYLVRIQQSTWPNPLWVLVDTVLGGPLRLLEGVGKAFEAFVSRFSWPMQCLVLVLAPVGLVLACWLWSMMPRVHPAERPRRKESLYIEEVETDDVKYLL